MSYTVHITKQGIAVFDGMAVVNGTNAEAVFQATKQAADNAAPIIEGALDTDSFAELLRDISNADMNALTRDVVASTLGILGGLATLPAGPAAALVTDQAFSEAYKKAHDAASAWSQNQDWWKYEFLYGNGEGPVIDYGAADPNGPGGDPFIPLEVNSDFAAARQWTRPRDPLVLDLDGDGIEATAIDSSAPVLFDHDADGVKTGTGWIAPDDGIVVLDLNGNGTIDSGRELFGDNTLLADGSTAANGFAAIAQHDANQDGTIDASDVAFTQLRIWKDANQDGISQGGELETLAELGIASINVTGQASTITLGNGNSQPWSGSFTRANGTTGDSGTPELSGSLLLASNNFYRVFTDDPVLTTAALALPQMGGSGAVRDLREAMSLPSSQAQDLQSAVSAFAAASTRDAQRALLQPLIDKWADTSAMQDALLRFGVTGPTQGGPGGALYGFAMSNPTFYEQVSALERFNGDVIFEQLVVQRESSYWNQELQQWQSVVFWTLEMSGQQRELLESAWEALQDSVYGGLVVQTRLQPYLDGINLMIEQDGVEFDTTDLNLRLDNAHATDQRNALTDLVELNQFSQPTLQATGFEGIGKLQGWIDALAPDSPLRTELSALRVFSSDSTNGTVFSDVYFGDAAAPNSFAGGDGNDVLVGGASADNLQGGTGNDTFDGRGGNDVISGEYHNTFHGWYGGAGNDTYLFGRGDDQDIVYDFDTTTGNFDQLVFKAGVLPADILVSRVGDHLTLKIAGTTDQVQINNYFVGDGAGGWALEDIRFREDQSTSWSVADIKTFALTGTAGNDALVGYASDDEIVGNDGNDTAYGRAGHDTLRGGLGDDILHGEAGDDLLVGDDGNDNLQGGVGDDTFDGGVGNDVMSGDYHNTFHGWYAGTGNDTYLFGRGDGQDTIFDVDASAGNLDKIVFKAGVAPSDVLVVRNGNHLVLMVAGTADQIQVSNYFVGDATAGWAIEEVRFTDDSSAVWTVADVMGKALVGGAANDTLTGYATDDAIMGGDGNDGLYGAAGNDSLDGGSGADLLSGETGDDSLIGGAGDDNMQGGVGDDTFDGGAGNDVMSGDYHNTFHGWYAGTGNDTYLFGRGDGQDTIYDVDDMAGNVDKIVFKAGVAPSDVLVVRNGNHLVLMVAGTADQIQVSNYFGGDATAGWAVEEVRFTDDSSVVWTVADVMGKALLGGAANDTLTGYATDDTIVGGDGNDGLYGAAGNDILDGGTGADLLHGETGDDSLIGGAGDDNMQGGVGDDTFDGGAGNDVMSGDYHNTFHGWYAGTGNDTYLFGRGDGQDTIYDVDGTAGNTDKLVFKTGVAPSDILLSRVADHLVLRVSGSTDQVQISNYFASDGTAGWLLEEIRFIDDPATVWRYADIRARVLVGTEGSDNLAGQATDDAISGNGGNDTIYGRAGNDVLDGGAGDDGLYGEAGNDTLIGMAGNDNMQGGSGDDTFDGGAGNDVMSGDYHNTFQGWYAGTGNDTYMFGRGDGQDTIYDPDGASGQDKVVFKAGVLPDDVQIVRSGDNLILKIVGTTDQILLASYFASDASSGWVMEEIRFTDDPSTIWLVADVKAKALVGTAGNDTLIGYATNDEIVGNTGNDTLYGRSGNDVIDGGVGDDVLYGEAGNDTLVGMAGNDNLVGAAGLDNLAGGDGSDVLQGGADDDVLDGGAGNDILAGGVYDTWNGNYNGAGNDTYLFGRGDGQDTLYDNDGVAGNHDTIKFKAGVAPADVQVVRSGDNLILKITGTTDQIQLSSYFANDGATSWSVEQVCFSDDPGQVWLVADVKAKALVGTASNETLIGYAGADTIYGGAGGDTLYGRAGNDTIFGEAGNDSLVGEAGDDSLTGGDGGDVLQGGAGNDTLDGGTGNDILAGGVYDTWNGNYNGAGNDTYLFGRGDGQDTLYDNDGVAGNLDKIVFEAGVAPADVQVVRNGDNLILKITGTADQIQVSSYFASDASSTWLIEQICFSDDATQAWSVDDVKAKALTGTANSDTLIGYASDDAMFGGAGGDTIYGRAGNDVIHGEADADNLIGEAGDDSLLGGAGGDVLQGRAGNDTLSGGTGNDVLAGGVYDTWNGNYNGAGNDTYLFGRGDGQDLLYDNDSTFGNVDQIIFAAGIATNQVQFTRASNNLVLAIINTTDQITISNYFASGNAWAVEEIRFADSEVTIIGVNDVNTIVANGGTIP